MYFVIKEILYNKFCYSFVLVIVFFILFMVFFMISLVIGLVWDNWIVVDNWDLIGVVFLKYVNKNLIVFFIIEDNYKDKLLDDVVFLGYMFVVINLKNDDMIVNILIFV